MFEKVESSSINRLKYLIGFVVVIAVIFELRLFQRQVIEHEKYSTIALKQYTTSVDMPAKRGNIYIKDKDNQNLMDPTKSGLFSIAVNLDLYNVLAVPKNISDKTETAKKIAGILSVDESKILDQINNDKQYVPPIAKRISKENSDKIMDLKITGISTEAVASRYYPEKNFMSHLLGFVNFDGDGKYGIEEYYDSILKGNGGEVEGLKDNRGRIIKITKSSKGEDGASLVLTIDRSIQYMVDKKLKEGIERYQADGGTIIVMDPKTGDVLAMASQPDYDPNEFNKINGDNQSIFLNPGTSLNWEPGSIFKPVTVSASINEDKLEKDSKPDHPFSNFVKVDDYEIHNSLDKPFGYESVTQILENSDNVGMVWIGDALGNELFYKYIEKYGFGGKTNIDVAGEASGSLRHWRKWRDINRATITFGQGISSTPIQIVQAYSVFANKGKMVTPRVVESIIRPDGSVEKIAAKEQKEIISEDSANQMTEMLESVCVNGHGKKAQVEGFKVAGKTGTAQIPKAEGGYEEDAHIGSFAGYAPADDPKFVMLVKFNRPKTVEWAESSAAPIFGEIADWLLNSYYMLPKST